MLWNCKWVITRTISSEATFAVVGGEAELRSEVPAINILSCRREKTELHLAKRRHFVDGLGGSVVNAVHWFKDGYLRLGLQLRWNLHQT
jgi:hypothetical protein